MGALGSTSGIADLAEIESNLSLRLLWPEP